MNQETIFVQTDPAFNVVLHSLKELQVQNRLEVEHLQTASLKNIESNDGDDERRFMFGGQVADMANFQFSRTASSVIRMCMLAAVNAKKTLWPRIGEHSNKRNRDKLDQQPEILLPPAFRLEDEDATRRYFSKYDQLYPHNLIQYEVDQVAPEVEQVRQARMPSMMLIFKQNFTQVIEITTTFTATPKGGQVFHSYIHVTCIVRKIKEDKESEDGEYTKKLKMLMETCSGVEPVKVQDKYFEGMTKVKTTEDLKSLPEVFVSSLKIDDENKKHEDSASQ